MLALSPSALHSRVPADTAARCPPPSPEWVSGCPCPGKGGQFGGHTTGTQASPTPPVQGTLGTMAGPPCPVALPPPCRVSAGWAAAACTPRYGAGFGGGHRLLCHLLPHHVPPNPSLCPPWHCHLLSPTPGSASWASHLCPLAKSCVSPSASLHPFGSLAGAVVPTGGPFLCPHPRPQLRPLR